MSFFTQLMLLFKSQKDKGLDLRSAVFTTRFVINGVSDIVAVYHDKDGDWQFLGPEGAVEDDAAIISLGEILNIDSSLKSIIDMKKGYYAYRNSKKEEWIIKKE